ncbi:MAG: NTP transferase domain-containing protein, partial [Paracoccaceae bacterium]|nr:NTP transferase domain-containing protein [Paracoccaceae bacterium]
MSIAIVIPAAGASARMRGRDKLLEIVEDRPLLRLVAERAIATGHEVTVVLPKQTKRRDVITDLSLTIVEIEDAAEGMSASVRAGVGNVATTATG